MNVEIIHNVPAWHPALSEEGWLSVNDSRARITTSYYAPPIPDRRFDWAATFDGYEPGDFVGRGPTEQAAVADLLDQWEQVE